MPEKKLKRFNFINMSHWGDLYILPSLEVNVVYSEPTITFKWWIFRIDYHIYKRFPDWFMKYVWDTLNLDFNWLKKEKEENEY